MKMKCAYYVEAKGGGSTTVTQKEERLNAAILGCYGADNSDNSQINK